MMAGQKPFDRKISGSEDNGFRALRWIIYGDFQARHSPQNEDKISGLIRWSKSSLATS
jgi:hypothetical protein